MVSIEAQPFRRPYYFHIFVLKKVEHVIWKKSKLWYNAYEKGTQKKQWIRHVDPDGNEEDAIGYNPDDVKIPRYPSGLRPPEDNDQIVGQGKASDYNIQHVRPNDTHYAK